MAIDPGVFALAKLFLYLILGTEGGQFFCAQEPTVQIDQMSTKDLWDTLNNVFRNHRSIIFDRYTVFTQKQLKEEPVEKLYGCFCEFSLNCDLGSHEEFIIRDAFIANMQDREIPQELLKKQGYPKKHSN